MPPIRNRICQPCVGTRARTTGDGAAERHAADRDEAIVARIFAARIALIATTLGMTPPIPRPASRRSQNNWSRLVRTRPHNVNTPNSRLAEISAALRP